MIFYLLPFNLFCIVNILTIDLEEWFQFFDDVYSNGKFKNYEVRIYENVERIFRLLEENDLRATFFVVGWIAKEYPDLVRRIAEKYEIGSHTDMHQLVYEQGEKMFREDVSSSIKLLEDISGKKVRCFRAPGFSITENEKWAFEVLAENGIEFDSSVFPSPRSHGGFPSYKSPVPSIIKYNGISLKELPINYSTFLSKHIIFSGGGYFRLFPYFMIKHWTKNSDYVMSYLHPRDFDSSQPMISELSPLRKFKSYVGLKGAEKKFEKWVRDFEFVDINEADKLIDWSKVPVIEL